MNDHLDRCVGIVASGWGQTECETPIVELQVKYVRFPHGKQQLNSCKRWVRAETEG